MTAGAVTARGNRPLVVHQLTIRPGRFGNRADFEYFTDPTIAHRRAAELRANGVDVTLEAPFGWGRDIEADSFSLPALTGGDP